MSDTISTFILSKDEASTIERTLESAAKFSDEIIVSIDDTTSDNTYDVIGRFVGGFCGKIIVYEYKWEDSFAKARNQAMDHCSCDWIMQLDAHEIVRPGDEYKIKIIAEKAQPNILAVGMLMLDEWREGSPTSKFHQDKFFRNHCNIYYSGDMHNHISKDVVKAEDRIIVEDVAIYHMRTPENNIRRRQQRLAMAEKIFLKQIEEDPMNTRATFYMAQTYLNYFKSAKAEEYYKLYLKYDEEIGSPYPTERAWVLYKLGMIAANGKDYNSALNYLEQSLRWRADSPWTFYMIAEIYHLQEKYDKAIVYYKIAGNTMPERDQLFQSNVAQTYGPWLGLAKIYITLKNQYAALEAAMLGLKRNPNIRSLHYIAKTSLEYLAAQIPAGDKKKKNLYIIDATGQFTPPLIDLWSEDFNIKVTKTVDMILCTWADVIFCEWGDENLLAAAQHKFKAPLITRIHSYEVFRDYLHRVNWKNVYLAVFVCQDKRLVAGGLPVRTRIIPNAVSKRKYSLLKNPDPLSLCWIGRIVPEKNLAYIIQLLSEVDPGREFKLHIAGIFQDPAYKVFIVSQLEKMNMQKNVIFHGWIQDINAWIDFNKPSVVLSASQRECTIPFGIQQAMMKGCQPIVYPYPGADDCYLPEMLFHDRQEFAERLYDTPKYPAHFWRDYLINKHPFGKYANDYRDIMHDALDVAAKGMICNATPYNTRLDIIEAHGKSKKVMEIGVYRGDFSKKVFDVGVEELHLVDPWEGPGNSGDKDGNNKITVPDISVFYPEICKYFEDKPNVKIVRTKSEDYLKTLPDDYFDLIYIDGDHSYQGIMTDLKLAKLKVKSGGYIAGHDYGPLHINSEVIAAVNDFAYENKYPVDVTTYDGRPSFVMRNNKPIKLDVEDERNKF